MVKATQTEFAELDENGPRPVAVVFDLDRTVTVDTAAFESKSENSPFVSWDLRGAPVMTVVGGKIVHDGR